MSDGSFVVVLCTMPADVSAAEAMARRLVEKRLAACVNLIPQVRSIYRWNDDVETADECQLLIKTKKSGIDALEAFLAKNHPFDVPEVVILQATASSAYGAWVQASVSSD